LVRYAWYVVLLLTATQVVSYIDRFLPSLLVAQIKRDLGVTDFEMSLLLGPAFGLFYVFVGVPIGWLADRLSRRGILATGIAIWCAMTTAGAFVRSFVPLLGLRLGVGLGEAAVAPCSVSLISDYFDRDARARAISIFMAGTFIGAGSAHFFGGPLVQWIGTLPPLVVPGLGALTTWQMAFLFVGTPGFLLALLMFTIREPLRQDQVKHGLATEAGGPSSFRAAVDFIGTRWRAFGTLFIGSASVVVMGSLAFWNVELFRRTWGWNVRDVGIAVGLLFFTAGPLGTWIGILLTNRWIAQRRPDATLRALWCGLLLAAPGFALYPIMPTAQLAIAGLFVAFTGQAMAAAAGPASLTLIAPGQTKAQSTAIYYLFIGIFGQMLGTPPVGYLTTHVFGDDSMLRYSMSIEAAVVGTTALIIVALGMAHYRRASSELESLIRA
jgi:MFS family permease